MKNFKAASVFLSLSLAFGAGAALAQSTSGNVIGDAKPGDTAIITNPDTGFSREVKVKDNGKFSARNVQAGTYTVVIRHEDGTSEARSRSSSTPARLRASSKFENHVFEASPKRGYGPVFAFQAKGSRRIIVASRSGPVDTIASGQPTSSSSERR
jgi:hypothetical protein